MEQLNGVILFHTWVVYVVWGGNTTYVLSFPRILKSVDFLVSGCSEISHSAGPMSENFMCRNFRSEVAVLQEGRETLPH